jgi:hypothetical protein
MPKVPTRVEKRIVTGIKKFQKILEQAKARDQNEPDTVQIVSGILNEILGYDLYGEITREFAIKNTYCDLAIRIDSEVKYLIEVKAIGVDLKDTHLKQALDYAANKGLEWAILTNGITWKLNKVIFEKPISFEEIFEIDFLESSHRDKATIERLYVLSKEAISKSAIERFTEKSQYTSKYAIAALLQTDEVANLLRRQMRHMVSGLRIDNEDIKATIRDEILKHDVLDSDIAKQVLSKIKRALKKTSNRRKKSDQSDTDMQSDGSDLASEPPKA